MRRLLVLAMLAAMVPLAAQDAILSVPRIDALDFYGLRQVSQSLVRQALGLKEGDPLPSSKGDTEDRLLDVDRIVEAHLEIVCCDEGKTTLYVGVQERDTPFFETRPAPGGAAVLPDEILSAYASYEQARHAAELAGRTGEDLSQGHPLMNDGASRAAQMRFPALVQTHLAAIRNVMLESADEYQRGIAASLLPYAANKAAIVEDLQGALTDDDSSVRTKALHGLTALALFGRANPAARIQVNTAAIVDLLQSIAWTDRTQTVAALEMLTRDRDKTVLASIKGDALASVIEMSGWHSVKDAYPPFQLIGRIAGLREVDIRDAWLRGGRDSTIAKARETNK